MNAEDPERDPDDLLPVENAWFELEFHVDKIVELCELEKFTGSYFTDYDPLISVMSFLGHEVRDTGVSLDSDVGCYLWKAALEKLQGSSIMQHNSCIPCRKCNKEFDPVIDNTLFKLFLKWFRDDTTDDVLAIHCCPDCGGRLIAESTRIYSGDMHTPPPGEIDDDEEWAEEFTSFKR